MDDKKNRLFTFLTKCKEHNRFSGWHGVWQSRFKTIPMKHIIPVFACALLFTTTVHAQDASVAIKAGVNLANVTISDNGSIDDAKTLTSFQAGVQADLPITKFFSLQPGLYFTGKGAKTSVGSSSDATYYKASSNPMYIELPLNAVFKLPLSKDNNFFVGAGPYAAMGIAGKNKVEGKVFGVAFNSSENIKFSNDDPTTSTQEGAGIGIMRRFDYGLNGVAGFEADAFLLTLQYGYGLANIASEGNSNANDRNKHRVLSLTLGVKL